MASIEDQVRNHDIDGLMWCNERNSPLDQMMQGQAPGDFSAAARAEATARGIDVEACRPGLIAMHRIHAGRDRGRGLRRRRLHHLPADADGHPEVLIWERFWLERNKDLDRELYGQVKW